MSTRPGHVLPLSGEERRDWPPLCTGINTDPEKYGPDQPCEKKRSIFALVKRQLFVVVKFRRSFRKNSECNSDGALTVPLKNVCESIFSDFHTKGWQ